jgi:hypothetical protein
MAAFFYEHYVASLLEKKMLVKYFRNIFHVKVTQFLFLYFLNYLSSIVGCELTGLTLLYQVLTISGRSLPHRWV